MGSKFNSARTALDYLLQAERDDFAEQCEENALTEEEGLKELNHVYAHAIHGLKELEEVEKSQSKTLSCSGENDCQEPVMYLDERGFVYCSSHGYARKSYVRCRALSPLELYQLKLGKTLAKF